MRSGAPSCPHRAMLCCIHTQTSPREWRRRGAVYPAHVAVAAHNGVVAGASVDIVVTCGPGLAVGFRIEVA